EIRWHRVDASDLVSVVIKKYPPFHAWAVSCRDDLVCESGIIRCFYSSTKPRAGVAGDMAQHKKIAVIETDKKRQNLRVKPHHPHQHRQATMRTLTQWCFDVGDLRGNADDGVERIVKQLDSVRDLFASLGHLALSPGNHQFGRFAQIVPNNP